MALAFDSVGPSSSGATTTTATLTFNHTVVGANVVLLAGIAVDTTNDAPLSCTCAYGGSAMTSLGIVHSGGIAAGFLQVFAIEAAAGSANVVATVAGGTPSHLSGGSIAISGAATPVAISHGTPVTANTPQNVTTSTATLSSNASGNIIVGFTTSGTSIASATAPSTSRFILSLTGVGAAASVAGATSPATGSPVTMAWTQGTDDFGELVVEILPFAGGGGPIRPPQQLGRRQIRRRKSSQIPQFAAQPPDASVLAQTATASAAAYQAPAGTPYITGLAGVPGPGYFTDQFGSPRLFSTTETWGLLVRAGANSSGNWQGDMDAFFAARAAQGFTVVMADPVWCESGSAFHGNTWDGLTPLTGGTQNPTGATLNTTFWARFDYLLASAASNGITVGFVIYNTGDDHNTGDLYNTWTTTQWSNYGALVGTRYQGTRNLIWLVGNDDFSPFSDSNFAAVKSGVTGTGDTHMWGVWYNPETTSRYDTSAGTAETFGTSNSAFNFCYSYNCEYWVIEYAYREVLDKGAANLLPAILGDGYFYQGSTSYSSSLDRAYRQMWWWALASGARGVVGESEAVYPWMTGAAAAVTGDWFFANNAGNIVSAYTGLTGWHMLIPDTGNALVTGGRGTRATGRSSGGGGGQYEPAFTNSYVAASVTPDGTLAVCYLPNATTITVNTALLATGWTATWVDPVTGATSSAGAGPTFNSTAKGSNSKGDPDWALAFQSTAANATAAAGLASATGAALQPASAVTATGTGSATGAGVALQQAAAVTAASQAAAAGTGTALPPLAAVTALPAAAAATGAAFAPANGRVPASAVAASAALPPLAVVTALAGAAAGTGAALSSAAAVTALPAAAPGTGTAFSPSAATGGNATAAAGLASAAGAAPQATALVTAVPAAATGTGAAQQATALVTAVPAAATGTGAAPQPAAAVSVLPGAASASGVAQQPVAQVAALPAAATGTGAAPQPAAAVSALPGAAAATGTAFSPSVTASGNATAAAGLASAAGVAQQPVAQVAALPAAATGTGAAPQPAAAVSALPGAAAATGTAFNASGLTGGNATAQPAPATAVAQQPAAVVTVFPAAAAAAAGALPPAAVVSALPGAAAATGAAFGPSVTTSGNASPVAGLAAGTGTAPPPLAVITVFAGRAAAAGAAFPAANGRVPGLASATGNAAAPALSLVANAQAATALAVALSPAVITAATVVKGGSAGTSVSEAAGTSGAVTSPGSSSGGVS